MVRNRREVKSKRLRQVSGALVISIVCFASANLQAQVLATRTSNGAMVSNTAPKESTIIPDAHPKPQSALPAGVSVVFSNFGTGSSLYNAASGWTEAGQEANDETVIQAMSFIPDANYILVRIDAAFTYVQGTNGMKLILAEDNGGIPGKTIYVASFTNLPVFGTCCTVQTVTLTPSKTSYVALEGGKTYWLYPSPADTTSYLVWNQDTTNQSGNGALNHGFGSGWTPVNLDPFGAFDIYGIKGAK